MFLDTDDIQLEISNGIAIVRYKSGAEVNLEKTVKFIQQRLSFFNGVEYPVLIYDQGVKSITKDARDYMASVDGVKGFRAAAMVLKSTFSMFLGNFLIKITRPPIPVRIFSDDEKAIEWLRQYKFTAK